MGSSNWRGPDLAQIDRSNGAHGICMFMTSPRGSPIFKIGLFKLLRSGDSKPLLKSYVLIRSTRQDFLIRIELNFGS